MLWALIEQFWPIIAGAIALLAGWLGLKGYGASKAAQGRAEARQQQEIDNARAALDAVEVTRRTRSDDDRRELRARHTRPG